MAEALPRPSESSTVTTSTSRPTTRGGPVNFSRPRPTEAFQPLNHDVTSQVHILEAFHQPLNDDLLTEPRLSLDMSPALPCGADANANANTIYDLAWDNESGEIRSQGQPSVSTTAQHYYTPRARSPESGSRSIATGPAHAAEALRSSTPPPIRVRDPRTQIIKRVSVTQHSETASDDWEDAASHHTMSDMGDVPPAPTRSTSSPSSAGSGGRVVAGAPEKWTSSDYDTSGLTEAELRKLRKKGINPALYAEMKAARKGKGKLSPLVGNTFLG